MKPRFQIIILSLLIAVLSGCTGQIGGSIRLQQRQETFSSQLQINTKIDLLWVVDNSASMDIVQDKLRKGFGAFATKYMSPTWDIRLAVIPSDLYLANAAFSPWKESVIPSTALKYKDLAPAWGSGNYGKLIAGMHDGPIAGLCSSLLSYFYSSTGPADIMAIRPNCSIRNANLVTGTANCISPGVGETATSQCVNTTANDTVRSGKGIISTMPPVGVQANGAWTTQIIDDFTVNVTTGTVGHGSERGIQSVLEMLVQNEGTGSTSALFRPDSLRGIIFVSDEEDQSQPNPSNPLAINSPFDNYACDQAGLVSRFNDIYDSSGVKTGAYAPGDPSYSATAGNYCCSGGTCSYGTGGLTCPSKTVDGVTYAPSNCVPSANQLPVSTAKTTLDTFFHTLDGSVTSDPNYFIVSIVPLTGTSIQAMQADRFKSEFFVSSSAPVGGKKYQWAVDRGDRYIALGNLVGNGSMALNIADADYSVLLDAIGSSIIAKKSTFTLSRAPTSTEEMTVTVVHADGSTYVVPANKYMISGYNLIITDSAFILSLSASDTIQINYQPKTLF